MAERQVSARADGQGLIVGIDVEAQASVHVGREVDLARGAEHAENRRAVDGQAAIGLDGASGRDRDARRAVAAADRQRADSDSATGRHGARLDITGSEGGEDRVEVGLEGDVASTGVDTGLAKPEGSRRLVPDHTRVAVGQQEQAVGRGRIRGDGPGAVRRQELARVVGDYLALLTVACATSDGDGVPGVVVDGGGVVGGDLNGRQRPSVGLSRASDVSDAPGGVEPLNKDTTVRERCGGRPDHDQVVALELDC